MGAAASVQTTVSTLSQRISKKLEQTADASATANCNVDIGSIIFKRNHGCNVLVRNMCSAQSEAQLQAIVQAVEETYNELSDEQKAYAPSLLAAALNIQTNVTTITKDFENYITQKCHSAAVVNNTIKIQNIEVDECSAPAGMLMTFEFVNTGTSVGNCAMKAVLDVLTKSSDRVSGVQASGTKVNWYILAAIVAAALLFFLVFLRKMFFTSTQDKIKLILAKKPEVHWTTYLDTFFSNSPTVL